MEMFVPDIVLHPENTSAKQLALRETVVIGKMPDQTNAVYKMQRQLFARSERVKGIDFHPVEPWILTTLYSGTELSARSSFC